MGSVRLGTPGDFEKPGVAGPELSAIDINTDGTSDGSVDLGAIGAIDSDDFTLTAGGGSVIAELGSPAPTSGEPSPGDGDPVIGSDGVWTFDGTGGDLQLTINAWVDFGAGGELVLRDVALTVGGPVDLSDLSDVSGLDDVTVPETSQLTLTAEQASGAMISGDGYLVIEGDLPVDYDFSGLTVENMDFSGVTGGEGVTLDLSSQTGTDFDITGTDFDDDITTADGNDVIDGGAGDDRIDGGAGADTVVGGAGDDRIVYDADDASVNGGDGTTDNGIDTLDASGATGGVTIDLTDTTDAFEGFENVIGSDFDDVLTGADTASDNRIESGGGNDVIAMGEQLGAGDVIAGGEGDDRLTFTYDIGTSGSDLLAGVTGIERLELAASGSGDVAITLTNDDLVAAGETLVIDASALNDQQSLVFDGTAETDGDFEIVGGDAGDIIIGGNQPNSDVITGGAGDDFLTGAAGDDTFIVDEGDDTITDLSESDILVVEAGASATAYVAGDWSATGETRNDGTGPVELVLGTIDPDGTNEDAAANEDGGYTIDLGAVTAGSSGFNLTTSGANLDFTLVGSAFDDTVTVTADAALAESASLGDFAVTLEEGVELTLGYDQLAATGFGNFHGTAGGSEETLVVTGYEGQAFDSTELGEQLLISELRLAADGTALQPATVELDPSTNLDKVQQVVIPEHVTLEMTAAQYQSLIGDSGIKVSGDGTLNITEMSSVHSDLDLSQVDANVIPGSITLVATESEVLFDQSAELDTADGDGFSIVHSADGQNVILSTEPQADGRVVNGADHTGSILTLGFTNADGVDDPDAVIEAGGFDVENVWLVSEYLYNEFGLTNEPANFEAILPDLRDQASNGESLVVTVKEAAELLEGIGDPDALATSDRSVVIDENTTVNASTEFNDLTDRELGSLDLTLEGNSVITGNLQLPQENDPLQTLTNEGKLPSLFQQLTINSEDVTGTAVDPNELRGDIIADDGSDGVNSESRAETFELVLDPGLSVGGSNSAITFDGALVALSDGDDVQDAAAKLAAAEYDNWTAEDLGGGVVEYTYQVAGDLATDPVIGDFTFDAQGTTTNLGGTLTVTEQGAFNAAENNLYDITINAEHDLVLSGELELSYVTRSNTLGDETVTGTITVNGDADVTIGSVNTDDEHIDGVTLIHNGTGTVTAPGTSPGAALGNTETLTINTMGSVRLGTDGDPDRPGVAGAELSRINLNTDGGTGTIQLGVIDEIDTEDFLLDVGGGNATATLGQGLVASTTGVVAFNGNDRLTLGLETGPYTLDGTLTLHNLDLRVEGSASPVVTGSGTLDVSGVSVVGGGTLDITSVSDVDIDPDAPLTVGPDTTVVMTGSQADGQVITGEGNLVLEAVDSTHDLGGIDVDGDITFSVSSGTGQLTLSQDQADGSVVNFADPGSTVRVDEVGDTLYADLSQLAGTNVAGVAVSLDEDAAATADFALQPGTPYLLTGGFEADLSGADADLLAASGPITVDSSTTLRATAEQLDGVTVDGPGGVIVTGFEAAPGADLLGLQADSTIVLGADAALAADAELPAGAVGIEGGFELDATALTSGNRPVSVDLTADTGLRLTPVQADGYSVSGAGAVTITSLDATTLAAAPLNGTIDLGGLLTAPGDTGMVALTIDATGDIDLDASDLGVAAVEIVGTGTADISDTAGGADRNDPQTPGNVSDDTMPSFKVGADAVLNLGAGQAGIYSDDGDPTNDGKTSVTGAGDVTVEDLGQALEADLSGVVVTGSIDAAFDTDGTFTGRLGNAVVTVADNITMTTSFSIATGNTIIHDGSESGQALVVSVDSTEADADLTTIDTDITDRTAAITETLVFNGDFADFKVLLQSGVALTTAAAALDGRVVGGDGDVTVSGLDTSAADLSSVVNTGQAITLDVAGGDAAVAAGFDLANGIAYTVTGGNRLDLTQADTIGDITTTFTVEAGSSLRATAEQLDGITVNGGGSVMVAGLDGSDADLSKVTVTGGVTLDTADGDAMLAAGSSLAIGVDYTIAGGNALDVTAEPASVFQGIGSLTVDAGTTLIATSAQLDSVPVNGAGSATVIGLDASTADLGGVTVDGGVSLNVSGGDAAVAAGFDLANGIDYSVTGGNGLDLTLADTIGDPTTTFTVEAGSSLRATAAQLDGMVVDGAGQVVVTDLDATTGADLSGITAGTTIVMDGDVTLVAGGRLPAAAIELQGSHTLDVTAADPAFDATSVVVPAGAALSATADQLDNVTVTGTGTVTVSGLDGSAADLGGIDATTVQLDVGTANESFVGTLADRSYDVVGGGTLDLSGATMSTTFELEDGTDLVLLASQVGNDGSTAITDSGTSDVTVQALEDQPDADLSGIAVAGTIYSEVLVGTGVTLSGDLNGAALRLTDSTDPSGTLDISAADNVQGIDFGLLDVAVRMTETQFDGMTGSTNGANATVRFATADTTAEWNGGALELLRLEDGSSDAFELTGLNDDIGEIQLDDANLRDMSLVFDTAATTKTLRVTSADALESVSLTGSTALDGTVILDSDQSLQLLESVSTVPGIEAEGASFTLQGEGLGRHVVRTGDDERPLDVSDVTGVASVVAGAGGLVLEKTAGGNVPTISVDALSNLVLDASQGDLEVVGAGGGSRTIGKESGMTNAVDSLELTLGAGDVSVTGGSLDVGSGTSLSVSGAGTATIERLALDTGGGTYTVDVSDLGSHLVLEDASLISLGSGGTLSLDGGADDAGQVTIGTSGALNLGSGVLDLDDYTVLGGTPGLTANLLTNADARVQLGNAEQTFDLAGNGGFTFGVNTADNGDVSVTGFDAGDVGVDAEKLDFTGFSWSVDTGDVNGSGNPGAETFDAAMDGLAADGDSWTLYDTTGSDALLTFTREGSDVVITNAGDGGFAGEITLVGVGDDLDDANFGF